MIENEKTAELLVGDMHLGEGVVDATGAVNPYEDFLDDEGFARLLDAWARRHADAAVLRLRFTGDVLDYSSIRHRERWGIRPTETVALDRTETCLRGHQVFWTAVRRFLKDPRAGMVFLVGNHDLDLSWPLVQWRIRRALDTATSNRIRFETESRLGKILVVHGDSFDLLYDNPSFGERFLPDPVEPKLNVPFNARLTVRLVAWLKRCCPPLGYLAQHGPAWALGLIRRSSALSAALFYLTTLNLKRHLAAHPEVWMVVSGHTHLAGVWNLRLKDGRRVTYLNPGAALAQVHPWRPWRSRFTEWTPVEIVRIGPAISAKLLRFDPATAEFSDR